MTLLTPERCITQTTFFSPENKGGGNCAEAAIATVLGIKLDQVPKFYTSEDAVVGYWEAMEEFLAEHGYEHVMIFKECIYRGLYLVSGPSARGCSHMVVYENGKLAWDPHPSRAGVLSVETVHILVPFDPRSKKAD